ncbi:MAG TPA: metalloregulator ArsR/SmtB family transcription factor [Casimicrobiaceae bacterium]|jgi:DNA-binding transcriptional ArsR family regulator|nr:metalloregulator ArsR/SmtB family transcription factor [Casimicrobiaceae bacterium]
MPHLAIQSRRSRSADLDQTFAALADPTRRAILARLARGEAAVGDLAAPFAISLPAVSRHLRVLEHARLIERRVDAQWRVCRLSPDPLRAAASWIERYRYFWETRLDDLAALLEEPRPQRRKR